MSEPVAMLLAKARSLRAERDRYAAETPGIVRALRAQGVSYSRIRAETGIPEGTASRMLSTTGGGRSTSSGPTPPSTSRPGSP